MNKAHILWIEDRSTATPTFLPRVRAKGHTVDVVPSGKEALVRLENAAPDVVVVNAASMRSSGKRICSSLRSRLDSSPIIAIQNGASTGDLDADQVLTLPFTYRKLLNRIEKLLQGNGERVLCAGPIRLDLERNVVRCEGREARLTPKQAQVLKPLMVHAGEVVERDVLFSQVWETDYTGDTRTLDVHVSWLRRAIEENPRKPRYLKTVRGVGYRLDVG